MEFRIYIFILRGIFMKFGKRNFKSLAAIAIGSCVVSCFSGRVSGMDKATFHDRLKMFNNEAALNERNDMRGVSYADKCCVCLKPLLTHKDELTFGPKRLVCGHVIHRNCMMEMYDHGMFKCPLCRKPMITKGNFI